MVINGYVIWGSKPTGLTAGIVNYFKFGTTVNQGLTIPTMLRISGKFDANELGAGGGQHLGVFVDAMVNRFFAATPDES